MTKDTVQVKRDVLIQVLEVWDTRAGIDAANKAFEALRAALAEPVQEPVYQAGCDHCNHPLYAGIKCGVCGRWTDK